MTTPVKVEESLDPAWTWVASGVAGASISIWLFIRSGITTIFLGDDATLQTDQAISVAFWGLLVAAGGLCALGALAYRFVERGYHRSGYRWPRFTVFEAKARDRVLARVLLGVVVVIPTATLVASGTVYLQSEVAEWRAEEPLAAGFFASRLRAWQTPCDNQPCFRMHPLDGHEPNAIQWFMWLNEPLILLLLGGAIYFWWKWARTFRQDENA